MKKSMLVFLILSGFTALAQETDDATNRIIVKFKSPLPSLRTEPGSNFMVTGLNAIDRIHERTQCVSAKKIFSGKNDSEYPASMQHVYLFGFASGQDIRSLIAEYMSTGNVDYAEPDYIGKADGEKGESAITSSLTPNDTYFNSRQWSMKNSGNFPDYPKPSKAGADIEATLAWDITTGDTNTVVAVMDSGLKLDHPEVNGRVWRNKKEVQGNGIDDDNNGYIDDFRGWDFANNDNNPTDDQGHGSNVAGIVGCTGNNSIGYAGMNWKCKIMVLKALDANNSGQYSWWASAITYAADNGARVINLSVGGNSSSTTLQNAITYAFNKGVLPVVSSGNDNSNIIKYPAACTNAMAIGSTSPDDTRTNPFHWGGGSNYANYLSVSAPGNYIYGLDKTSNTQYGYYWSGTSQAAPHVTGLASLLLAVNPSLTPAQMKSIIEQTAEDKVGLSSEDVTGWDQYHGWGRINAHKALLNLTTSMKEQQWAAGIMVYPNPAKEYIPFSLPESFRGSEAELRIYNSLGSEVAKNSFLITGTMEWNCSSLPQGIYVYTLRLGTNEIFSGRMVKQE